MSTENLRGNSAAVKCGAPKVAILTVNLNMGEGLAKTIASVRSQTFHDFEFGIVDGASSDGSLELIGQNADIIDWWVSEKDQGIYDAMNKATTLSKAEWVIFLNSGDRFFAPDTLDQIFSDGQYPADILYGDAQVVFADGHTRLWPAALPERLPYGMICSHQSLFARRKLLLDRPFKLGKSASDYGFILRAWVQGKRLQRLPIIVSEFSAGGLSDRKRFRSLRESWEILQGAGLAGPRVRLYHSARVLRAAVAQLTKQVLPPPAVRWIRSKIGR